MSGECDRCGEHTTDCKCFKGEGVPEICSRMIAFEESMNELEALLEEENEKAYTVYRGVNGEVFLAFKDYDEYVEWSKRLK